MEHVSPEVVAPDIGAIVTEMIDKYYCHILGATRGSPMGQPIWATATLDLEITEYCRAAIQQRDAE